MGSTWDNRMIFLSPEPANFSSSDDSPRVEIPSAWESPEKIENLTEIN